MNCSSYFTNQQGHGGVILKGQTRNERQPVHMMLVVDTSGSMELEDKLPSVKKSIQLMLDLLSPEDRISLVTFADDSKTFLKCVQPTSEERQAIVHRVNNLNADGSTNMSAGLLEARPLVEPPSSSRKQGIILLTDGHANIGVHSEQGLIDILKRVQNDSPGLSLTTVAYGVDHNAEMLMNLAKVGGGAYNVVKNLEDVATVFGDILGGLISVSAQKVEIQFPPDTEVKTSFRTEKDSSGNITVYIGDVYADAEITCLFKTTNGGQIKVKGTDMTTLNAIDVTLEPSTQSDVPIVLVMAEYRQEVVTLLQNIRANEVKDKITALMKRIQEDVRIKDHPLKPILIEDLQKAEELSKVKHLSQHDTVEMYQHCSYLGTTKGLRSNTHNLRAPKRALRQTAASPVGVIDSEEESNVPPAPQSSLVSPFANRMQTQLASAMRTMSSQNPHESSHA